MTPLALYDIVRATIYLDQVTDDEYDETDDADNLHHVCRYITSMTRLALYDVVRATVYLDQVTDDEYDETDDVDFLQYH